MKGLPPRARVYLCAVAAAGLGSTAWVTTTSNPRTADWLLTAGIALVASLAQLFEVRTPNNRAYNGTVAFLMAAALLLPPAGCAVVAMAPFVVEQLRRPKQVHVQVFHLSSHLLATLGAAVAFRLVAGGPVGAAPGLPGSDARSVGGAVAALLVFLVLDHGSLVLALWWTRGVRPADSGLLAPESLLTDSALLALGIVVAALWSAGPALVAFALVPYALIQRALHFPELRHASRTDPKTGLPNSAYFTEVAEEEVRRAARIGHPLSVLVADLDLLRNVNNAYGHLAGDVVLRGVADVLREEVREYDVVARCGGEEFAILLPAADAEEARTVAERIRGRVAREAFEVDTSVAPIGVTLSIGLAEYGAHGETVADLLHAADVAVRRAKLDGRDRVRAARRDDDAPAAAAASAPRSPVTRILVPGASVSLVPPSAARATGPRRATWPITLATALLTAATVAATYGRWPEVTAAALVFPLLALAAELSGENVYGSGFVSLSAVPILGAVASGRPVAALLAAAVSGIAGSVAGRARAEQFVFNTANLVLSAAAAVWIRLAVDVGELTPADLPVVAAVMLGATAAYYLVDNGLVSLVVGRDEGREPLRVFREDFAWLAPHFLVFGVLATLLGVGWEEFGAYGLAAFLLPPLMVRVAQRQYLAKTTSNVAALRRLADDLAESKAATERSNVALEQALVQVRERHLMTARALAGAIDARDKTTGGHIERVSALGQAMCEVVDPLLAADPQVVFGFLLHDVGKIGVPDSVLLKTGPLTAAERAVINRHPEIGEALLGEAGFADVARQIVLTHHERWDGSGYPRGLKGTEIPLCSRLFAVADSLDAMTNDRPYRKGMGLEAAFDELRKYSGSQFDPEAVEALLSLPVERVRECLRLGLDDVRHAEVVARMLG